MTAADPGEPAVFLLHCPRCWGVTPHTDGEAEAACRWCGWSGRPPLDHVIRDPAVVRRHVLNDLGPVVTVFALVGVAHLVVAGLLVFYFTSLNNRLALFADPSREVLLIAVMVVTLTSGVLILGGGLAVRTGRNRLLAVTGAWLVITSPLLVGLPFGVWALRRLTAPEVREAFALRRLSHRNSPH